METAYEERRAEVASLLKTCTEAKLLRGATGAALDAARRAYELAVSDPALPAPWPQLTAYRLGHLILRRTPNEEQLHEADELFARASGGAVSDAESPLGPMPRLYRLAILHRLSRPINAAGASVTAGQLELVFNRARSDIERWLSTQVTEPEGDRRPHQKGPIQDGVFNMLELAAYFLGAKYELLEGLSGPYSDLMLGPNAWIVVGTGSTIAGLRMPRQLAFAELEDRGRLPSDGVRVLFRLFRDRAEWKLAEQTAWTPAIDEQIHLLAYLLYKRNSTTQELRRRVTGGDGEAPEARFRQVKRRLNLHFRKLTDVAFDLLPAPNPQSHVTRIATGATIFGAVDASFLRRRSPARHPS